MRFLRIAMAATLAFAGGNALAQESVTAPTTAAPPLTTSATSAAQLSFRDLATRRGTDGPRGLYFSTLLGVQSTPEYFGSDTQTTGVKFSPGLVYLNLGWLTLGEPFFADDPKERKPGFGLRGSFRFIGGREADDFDALAGLDDIDPTLEVGTGLGYTAGSLEVYADARYGLGGSDAWVGELGGNLVMRPSDRLALRVGPRFLYGSEGYTDTYFGVTPAESVRSGLAAFDADKAGLVSAGLELTATYRLGEQWWLEGGARYDRLQGRASDSPIVTQGSADQTEVHIGIRRAFVLEF